ncbi:MAG: hypothetical protein ISR70_04205 [Candidatus Thioglobus sp.]|nr:hypothetical protein [Candidatus Thioglobus sp.]
MKKIVYFILALIIVLAGATYVFFDRIAKTAIESYAQQSLSAPVSIKEVRSDWSAGKINIDFVEVGNPAGFANDNAFVLNHLSAELAEQQGELIILERLEFDGLLFTLEQQDSRVNLVELLKQLDQQSPASQGSTSSSSISVPSQQQSNYRIKINKLSFINTQLFIDTQWFKDTVVVPNIIIQNFGRSQGMPVAQVGAELMKIALMRIQSEVEKNGLRLSEQEIKQSIQRQLRQKLEDSVKDLDAGKLLEKLGF